MNESQAAHFTHLGRSSSKKSLQSASNQDNANGGHIHSVFDMDKRVDALGTGCRQGGSGFKEKDSHFLPMIEQPPASLRKVNNLFADVQ